MSLVRSFATVGAATLASRVLGFVRDALLAATLGAGPVADAFVVAFRLPNLFRRLFAEGAFNSAFVPLFGRTLEEEGTERARQVAGEIASGMLLVLLILLASAEIAMPAVVWALAPGFLEDPAKFDLTVLMSRICFPYLVFMSMLALIAGILNTHHRFAAAAFAPVMLNLVMIGVLVAVTLSGLVDATRIGLLLCLGVSVAGLAQLAVVLWDMRRLGFRFTLPRPRVTPAVRRLVALGVPGLIAGGITQINIVVGQVIASSQESANALLYYADRLYQLPLGVIGIAIGVVLLPSLTRHLRAGEDAQFQKTLNDAMQLSFALTLPASVALVVIPDEIVSVLFGRGAFDAAAVSGTAAALAAFSFGLPAYVLSKVFSPGFFAREDTKTPMWFAGLSAVVNVVLSLLLFPVLAHVGIALATTVAGWVNALALGAALWRRGHFEPDASVLRKIGLLALASLAMGLGIHLGADLLSGLLAGPSLGLRVAALGVLVGGGMAVFALLAQASGAVDLVGLARLFRQRRRNMD